MDMHVEDRFRGHRALRRGRVSLPGQVYHVTVATRDRNPWFANFHVGCEAVRAFRQPSALADARLLAWVLMPDHAHWLVELGPRVPLEMVVSRMKAATGVQVNRMLARAGALWGPAFHDRALRQEDDLRSVARYIVANPLRAGLVERIGDYPFWDCVWLDGASL
ncbi:transposase [Pseudoxanthomonas daejeonensis]|uniref:REP-associated tyrosine transposase n=1 Tax=Pseudoxanthomonas daejeonensis TaxID=266062 RepID=UPI001F53F96E|nr:transposase [Pseudoxanthomonas daejeonensis]UNK56533.1 transposase [Pseudoxanthomonas daejeonensis]